MSVARSFYFNVIYFSLGESDRPLDCGNKVSVLQEKYITGDNDYSFK